MSNNSSCDNSIDYQNKPLGTLYILHGLLYYPFYIPCALAIFTRPLISANCYQIMAPMAVLDLLNLTYGALISGYWSIIGFSFCRHYWLMKIVCAIMNGSWTAYCALCVVLGINRVLDICDSRKIEQWFSYGKTLYWVGGCFIYGSVYTVLYLTQLATLVYDSKIGVFMFLPVGGSPVGIAANCFNNIGTIILLVILYTMVGTRVKQLTRTIRDGPVPLDQLSIIKLNRIVTCQCFCICFLVALTCLFYSTVPLITNKVWAFQMTNLFWQMTHGGNGIIYLTLNRTIRQRVREIFTFRSHLPTPLTVVDQPLNVNLDSDMVEDSL